MTTRALENSIKLEFKDPKGFLSGPWMNASEESAEREVSVGIEEAGGPEIQITGRIRKGDGEAARWFVPERDQVAVKAFEQHPEYFDGTVLTRVFLDAAGNPIPGTFSTERIVVTKVAGPPADAESSERALMKIEYKALTEGAQ